ncbi:MAG: bifunctional 4-hydroxy-2-oxoglutarate aldolase/2-dehydro-3-deoxy-phosphogluconate aldolase [Lentisphaerae bacterium]|nr:bifunctional 4-hydroxy-2-oxoglutarate aldolase/2-dehydro-3-deoxy-phosphogluconate aldolase [Lentisphaerota bacterium]
MTLPDAFLAFPVIGILRGLPPSVGLSAARTAAAAGLAALEVTLNSPDAPGQIRALREALGPAAWVGAGTVTDAAQARLALAAGAQFLVSPMLDEGVMAVGREAGVALFPGALTPTEVMQAWRQGASMVKVFPAEPLGPGYIKALKAPLDTIPLLPTGGIGLENAAAYMAAGAAGLGIGSPLFDRARMLAEDWAWLTARVHDLRRQVDAGRARRG